MSGFPVSNSLNAEKKKKATEEDEEEREASAAHNEVDGKARAKRLMTLRMMMRGEREKEK